MDWIGRFNYIQAKHDVRRVELYAMDLLWSIARKNFSKDVPTPSDIWNDRRIIDHRSARQIMEDTIKGLGR